MEQSSSNHFSFKTVLIVSALLLGGVSIMNTWKNVIIVNEDQFNTYPEFSNPVVAHNSSENQVIQHNYKQGMENAPVLAQLEEQTEIMNREHGGHQVGSVLKQEAQTLSLVEAYSPNMSQGINKEDISGEISTENGQIKSLSFSIPGVDSFELSNVKVEGNVFRFNHDGKDIQGMVYPISNTAYLVNFITGPMQGMRLRFNTEEAEAQQLEYAIKIQEEHERMQAEAALQAEQNADASASKSIASEVDASAEQVVTPVEPVDPNYEVQPEPEVAY